MIEWCLHSEPYTENSSEKSKSPESFLTNPPPLVDRLELIDPHDSVCKNVDEEEVGDQD